jgi:hypothetical protein
MTEPKIVSYGDPGTASMYRKECQTSTPEITRSYESRRQPQRKDEEKEGIQKLFDAIGHISISDAAFALQPFSGSTLCGNLAEKWLEKFNMYVAFKKLGKDDQLQLFQLLMKDRAADWLRALTEHKKADMDVLTRVCQPAQNVVRREMEAESGVMEA